MKRIIKTAVAVAVCGLAAAVAVPAQADNSIRVSGSGIVESFGVTGQTAGFRSLPPVTGQSVVTKSTIRREAPGTGAVPVATGSMLLNGQEVATVPRVHDINGPYDEVDKLLDRMLGISPRDVYDTALDGSPEELYDAATVEYEPLIDLGNLVDTPGKTGTPPTREGLKSQSAVEDEHMTDALRLAPVVREATPAEVAPIADSLPGVVSAATLDEVAPLVDATTDVVDNNTHRSANSAGELQGAVTESIAQTNDLVAQH
ncbi:hypothetical protein [Nonomuraea dietziae]|uniref:hypothetical protein n=1 Tax=Nonomuraea dietziae TaxID=65515 RepID=UPI0033C04057